MPVQLNITIISSTHINSYIQALSALLIQCVDDGASIGFLPPLATAQASQYWQQVNTEIINNEKVLIIANNEQSIVGCVQLSLCNKANAQHRVEVEKLMVSPDARKQGIAKVLMNTLEAQARLYQRSLIILDTREGDAASYLYKKLDYREAGTIPNFAINAEGGIDATVFFYKQLT